MAEGGAKDLRVEDTPPPAEGKAIRVNLAGTPVAVFNVGGTLYAVDADCPHEGGPLDEGPITGTTVECPWHGSQFDVRSGELRQGPATDGVRAYRVRVEGRSLFFEEC